MSLNQTLALINTINAKINMNVTSLFTVDIYIYRRINQAQRKTTIIQFQQLCLCSVLTLTFVLTLAA